MVIFNKTMRQELSRINEAVARYSLENDGLRECVKGLESEVKTLKEQLAELKLTVENGFDDNEPKKSPQQLVREWFSGEEGK